MPDQAALRSLVVDSLEDQIAVIDETGSIVDVNAAWTRFGVENGISSHHAGAGCNYLEAARAASADGDTVAAQALDGILAVVSGAKPSFYLEYPCHSPDVQRWFIMRVRPLRGELATFLSSPIRT